LVEGDLAYSSESNKNTTFAIEVDQIKIDKIFDEYCEKNNVKYLKMDIEGGEFDIFDRLFSERKDILSKIKFLHLEIHKFEHKPYKQLEENVKNIFGSRVFFDT
jgi:FkbM family methyltransferase